MLYQDLEKEIITLRVQNRYAALQLQNIQDEIEHFSSQYYSAIEDICIDLAGIENKIKTYEQKTNALKNITTESSVGYNIQPRIAESDLSKITSIQPKARDLENEVKNLYRNLIKLVHPDVSEEKLKASEYTMMVNKAYNERNYRQLVELDQIIRSGNATEMELKAQRNKLIDATFELKMQREDLLDNPLYLLSEEFAASEDEGVSMMQDVRAKLSSKITERKRDLRETKLGYLEQMAQVITTKVEA